MALLSDGKLIELIKDSDFQFVIAVTSGISLLVHGLTGWPGDMPGWVIPVLWLGFLFAGAWLALTIFAAWMESRSS